MAKNRSLKTLLETEFKTLPLSPEWLQTLGEVPINFSMLIAGPSGSGKTTFALHLARYLSTLGKVYYNSAEQGFSKSLKDQIIKAGLAHSSEAKFMVGDKDGYEAMVAKIKSTHPRFVILDSVNVLGLTFEQFTALVAGHKGKSFILIAWGGAK